MGRKGMAQESVVPGPTVLPLFLALQGQKTLLLIYKEI